jgi:hypothetical protein
MLYISLFYYSNPISYQIIIWYVNILLPIMLIFVVPISCYVIPPTWYVIQLPKLHAFEVAALVPTTNHVLLPARVLLEVLEVSGD